MSAQHASSPANLSPATIPLATDRLELGASGLRVSPYCIGMIDDPDTIPAAFDVGINFFFVTADMHWPLYESTRVGIERLLRQRPEARDEIVVAGVAYVTQPEFCVAPFEELIDAVPGLDHLDVAIAGGAYSVDLKPRMEVLLEHRRDRYLGLRAVGASFHERQTAADWLNRDELDIAFIRYNPMHQGAHDDLFPRLGSAHRALMYGFKSMTGYVPAELYELPEEYWMPEPTDYYRFVLSTSPLQGILCSPSTPSQVAELAQAVASGPLDDDQQEHMLVLAELLKGAIVE